MLRRIGTLVLVGSLLVSPVGAAERAAEDGSRQSGTGSSGKRVVWALIGAGIGFGAGLLLGLRWFDDAVYSERKILTTAIVAAAAGGVAGGLLSGQVGPAHQRPVPSPRRSVSGPEAISVELFPAPDSNDSGPDRSLLMRVRDANASLGFVTPSAEDVMLAAQANTRDTRSHRRTHDAKRRSISVTPQEPRASRLTEDPLWNGMLVGSAVGAAIGVWYVPDRHCEPAVNPECPAVLRIVVGIPAIASGAALGALVDKLIK